MAATGLSCPVRTGILYHLPWQYELALRQQMRSVPAMQAAQEHEQDGDGVSMASQEAEEAEDGSPTDVSTGAWDLRRS